MHLFDVVTWTADPVIFEVGFFSLRWYALMFIFGFMIGSKLMEVYYKHDGVDPEKVYTLFLYCFVGTIVGARLGHCQKEIDQLYIPMQKVWPVKL